MYHHMNDLFWLNASKCNADKTEQRRAELLALGVKTIRVRSIRICIQILLVITIEQGNCQIVVTVFTKMYFASTDTT